jgi:hypothetical protein
MRGKSVRGPCGVVNDRTIEANFTVPAGHEVTVTESQEAG